jgi:hypothetical protein
MMAKEDFFSALFCSHEQREMLGGDEALVFEEGDDVIVTQAGRAGGGVGHDLDYLDPESFGDLEVIAQGIVDRRGGDTDPGAFPDGGFFFLSPCRGKGEEGNSNDREKG